jgi:hypothetical protein
LLSSFSTLKKEERLFDSDLTIKLTDKEYIQYVKKQSEYRVRMKKEMEDEELENKGKRIIVRI